MASGQLNKVVEYLRRVVSKQEAAGRADIDLLNRYVAHRDELAFEAIVRRHGAMVFGVCRRVLHDFHDAEDAFQATFLVLVRKAGSLRTPGMLANWLYGVAYRTAMHARKKAAMRRIKEAVAPAREVAPEMAAAELSQVVDEELQKLPEKYRSLLVLCDLEGRTRREVAGLLGMPEGTVASRLAHARTVLAKQLTRRGIALGTGTILGALSADGASAAVPPFLVITTVKAAAAFAAGHAATAATIPAAVVALAEGVLKTMLLSKTKNMVVVLLTLGLLTGTGAGVAYQVGSREQVTEKPGQSAKIELAQKGLQTPDKALRLMTEQLEHLRAEQETLKQRILKLEDELKQGQPKKAAEGKTVLNVFRVHRLAAERDGDVLIKIITNSIEPNSWDFRGGAGSIMYLSTTESLVVSQTIEILVEVSKLIDKLDQQYRDAHKADIYVQKVYAVPDLIDEGIQGEDSDSLLKLIVNTIEPWSWRKTADHGSGTIEYFPQVKSLAIVQTADIQSKVAALLTEIRSVRSEQVKKKG
jgi:RNA polymerase sigma factor (sigma-70 family)